MSWQRYQVIWDSHPLKPPDFRPRRCKENSGISKEMLPESTEGVVSSGITQMGVKVHQTVWCLRRYAIIYTSDLSRVAGRAVKAPSRPILAVELPGQTAQTSKLSIYISLLSLSLYAEIGRRCCLWIRSTKGLPFSNI